ncbi:head-tail adaptor protein [Lutimaribacter sp. EGI FJ00015]|uniref:Head-tail adaptor protein n=1 Tax=Lutimaribacter degradans TaxID=2945989 RepID=A0ACC5ZRT5_9RHOB|nr:head-tail adaptor protein [Lutimaribacter sp. EGI FJ00013]MCM2561034.1 head-tail adaptor protein [Lutimaribacter sp. EGI FJ00013]MCO0612019.1 head-tail adaptor protein [Lutimaribacter sp. EGI FJ00015]MCO0634861.1 head-tail adaptor protein [Lutimaribacter sp. EGI FJ00014]
MSGRLNLTRALTLETPVEAPDGAGGLTRSWVGLGTLWAEVVARTGREREGDGAQMSLTGYRITVRAAPVGSTTRPRPEQRFREGSRVFRIMAVAERDPRGRYLTCFAQEEVVA